MEPISYVVALAILLSKSDDGAVVQSSVRGFLFASRVQNANPAPSGNIFLVEPGFPSFSAGRFAPAAARISHMLLTSSALEG